MRKTRIPGPGHPGPLSLALILRQKPTIKERRRLGGVLVSPLCGISCGQSPRPGTTPAVKKRNYMTLIN
jgi:hypothetical protein